MAKIADDKYYTPKSVVKAVLKVVEKELMPLEKFSRIIEPSAGAGAFLRELPKGALGFDILPEYEGVIKGDYLKQEIPYLKNSLVVGNPPFGVGGQLVQKFIEKSLEHSDYVAFVIPGDNYKKPSKLKGVKLYKSFMLPKAKYSGVALDCCFNIYTKGVEKVKKVKGVEVVEWHKNSNAKRTLEWEQKDCDFRIVSFGGIRILKPEEKTYCGEIKIKFEKKVNFTPILEAYLKKKAKTSVSTGAIHHKEIIDLIYDTYEDLREN